MNKIFAIVTMDNGQTIKFFTKEEYRSFMITAVAHNLDVVTFHSYRVASFNIFDAYEILGKFPIPMSRLNEALNSPSCEGWTAFQCFYYAATKQLA